MENIQYNGLKEDFQDIIDNGYEFKLGEYIQGGIDIVKQDMGRFGGFTVILIVGYILLGVCFVVIANLLYNYEVIGYLYDYIQPIGSIVIPLIIVYMAMGYMVVADKIYHEVPYSFYDFFKPFKNAKQLLYYQGVNFLLLSLSLIPSIIYRICLVNEILITKYYYITYSTYFSYIPIYSLLILFSFAPFLIIFGNLKAKDAILISSKIIGKKFLWFLLFYILLYLIMYSGLIVLLIGVFISIPIGACSVYIAYNDIIAKKPSALQNKIEEIGTDTQLIDNEWK